MEIVLGLAKESKARSCRASETILVGHPSLSYPLLNCRLNRCFLFLKEVSVADSGLIISILDPDAVVSHNFKRIVSYKTNLMTLRNIGLLSILY